MFCLRRRDKQSRGRNGQENEQSSESLPQELLDDCMSYLEGCRDLNACALVCRSWSFVAQRLLFRFVWLSKRRYERFEKILRTSPHLAQYTHTLILSGHDSELKSRTFEKLCCVPFTHLTNLFIYYRSIVSSKVAVALQRLFSLPTLHRLILECRFANPAAFCGLWADCSPSLRHLHLGCSNRKPRCAFPTLHHSSDPIVLESLRLEYPHDLADWLNDEAGCPFDLSRLAVLSVQYDISRRVFKWPRMLPAFETLEALEFFTGEAFNLSLFPKLLFLRVVQQQSSFFPNMKYTLSTIPSSSRIQQIVLSIVYPVIDACDELDSVLSSLLMQCPPTVGLEMKEDEYTSWAPLFPRLHTRNLLHRTDFGWFEAQLGRRNLLH